MFLKPSPIHPCSATVIPFLTIAISWCTLFVGCMHNAGQHPIVLRVPCVTGTFSVHVVSHALEVALSSNPPPCLFILFPSLTQFSARLTYH